MKRGRRTGRLAWLVAGILLAATAWPWIEASIQFLLDRHRVLAWLSSFGAWAPVVFVGVSAVQVVLAPIPGQFIGVAGGYLFGAGRGLLWRRRSSAITSRACRRNC